MRVMDPADIRRWVANHRAAAAREMAEMRDHPMTAAEAYASAMALLVLDEKTQRRSLQSLRSGFRTKIGKCRKRVKLRARWGRGR